MAKKADFTEQEWESLQRGVVDAGLLVSLSDRSVFETFKEAGAGQVCGSSSAASYAPMSSAAVSARSGTPVSKRLARLSSAVSSPRTYRP